MSVDKLSFHTLVEGIHGPMLNISLHHRVLRTIEVIQCLEKKYGLGPDFDALLDIVDSAHPLGSLAGRPEYTTTAFEEEKRPKNQRNSGDRQTRTDNVIEVSIMGTRDFMTWEEAFQKNDSGICGYLINVKAARHHVCGVFTSSGQFFSLVRSSTALDH